MNEIIPHIWYVKSKKKTTIWLKSKNLHIRHFETYSCSKNAFATPQNIVSSLNWKQWNISTSHVLFKNSIKIFFLIKYSDFCSFFLTKIWPLRARQQAPKDTLKLSSRNAFWAVQLLKNKEQSNILNWHHLCGHLGQH